ncbi:MULTISPECIES: C40 family peptidase [Paenibacillus]|uniref:C40 family peptidase n=1 Tax=Paenibacillus TaxID=44249 RepID=UPI0022B90BF3|nr:NlpC/P60 family protein [Paenibacillus caseinilyticus]MCZ8518465.1 NlpC/P60 family protein [Paenibacillus caseinilyticus]
MNRRFYRKLLLSCAFSAAGLFGVLHAGTAEAAANVKIQINDSLVSFPEAQPFIDPSNQMQIPLRTLTEELGYQVSWEKKGEVINVTLINKNEKISLQTASRYAEVDGKRVELDSPAQFISGSVYLPLRFVSETFGYRIQWDADNRIAIINEDGQYHAPAWYKQQAEAKLQAQAQAQPQPLQSAILQSAYQYLGTPYAWGGSSPGGFDCSGYVGYVFGQKGVSLPRTSVEMYQSAGSVVTDLQAGDLVFFAEGGRVSHVGIYTGNGQFISSASSSGVSIASITTGYWGRKYVGAKRV